MLTTSIKNVLPKWTVHYTRNDRKTSMAGITACLTRQPKYKGIVATGRTTDDAPAERVGVGEEQFSMMKTHINTNLDCLPDWKGSQNIHLFVIWIIISCSTEEIQSLEWLDRDEGWNFSRPEGSNNTSQVIGKVIRGAVSRLERRMMGPQLSFRHPLIAMARGWTPLNPLSVPGRSFELLSVMEDKEQLNFVLSALTKKTSQCIFNFLKVSRRTDRRDVQLWLN